MSILVRLADLDNESSEILGLLQANLPNLPHKRRHNWLYRTNPDGPAWVWFAIEKNTGDIVGLTSLFPRSMWLGTRLTTVGQIGDFAIRPSHRSLGPAVQLQCATF